MLLLGAGPRALLLQIAHPAVAAGVADHSDFRTDPWRRLAGTLRSYLTIVYGTTAAARAEIRRLNALHRGITGPGYSARDPELSLWVHATLVESTIAVYDAWLEPLPTARRAAYYAETRRSAGRSACRRRASRRTSRRSSDTSRRCSARPARSMPRRSRASWPASCSGRRSPRLRPCCRSRPARRPPSCGASRPVPTPGPCGRPSACCRRPSARTTGCRGDPWSGRCRPGSSPAGGAGVRCCRPAFRQMPKARAADDRVAGSGADPGPSAIVGQ